MLRATYVSLTDLYFADLMPEAAEAKIRSFSENKHPFCSLSEAHTEIMRLAHLSSLDLRNRRKQKVAFSLKNIFTAV